MDLSFFFHEMLRISEIDQLDLALVCDINVVRTDISVEYPASMHLCQSGSRLSGNLHHMPHGKLSALGSHELAEIHAIQKFHHKVAGLILVKEVVDLNHRIDVAHLLKQLRLLPKPGDAVLHHGTFAFRKGGNGSAVLQPVYRVSGKELLDGAESICLLIEGLVSDSEATRADAVLDDVSMIQLCVYRQ